MQKLLYNIKELKRGGPNRPLCIRVNMRQEQSFINKYHQDGVGVIFEICYHFPTLKSDINDP